MIFIINLTRGQMRFLTSVARVTCLVLYNQHKHMMGDVNMIISKWGSKGT